MEFSYFNFSFWRGEVSRVVISYTGLDVKDNNYDFKAWGKLIQSGKAPYNKMPYLLLKNGKYLTQAAAISKYLATIGGLMPTTPEEVAGVDEVYGIIEEVSTIFGKTMSAEDKVAKRKVIMDGIMTAASKNLDKIIDSNEFVVGNKLSVVDILIWSFYNFLESGNLDGVDVEFSKQFKNVRRVINNVANDKKIAAFKKNEVARLKLT